MEHGRIEREIHIDASPEVVFDVVETNAAGEACMTGTVVARPAGAAPS